MATEAETKTEIVRFDPKVPATKDQLTGYLKEQSAAFLKTLPAGIEPQRFMHLVYVAAGSWTLRKCSGGSIIGALLQCVHIGLEPNTPLGHAYLVPYRDKKGREICTLIVGYKGFIDLAYRSNRVRDVNANIVYQAEVDSGAFRIDGGTDPRIRHAILIGKDNKEMGKQVGAYAVVRTTQDGVISRYLSWEKIKAARPPHWKKTPWNDDREIVRDEMFMKTPLRRVMKYAPISSELATAIVSDEAADRGVGWIHDAETGLLDLDGESTEPLKATPEGFTVPPGSPGPTPEEQQDWAKEGAGKE